MADKLGTSGIGGRTLETEDLPLLSIADNELARASASALSRVATFDLVDSVVCRLERRAFLTPDKIAASDEEREVTYLELTREVQSLAHRLQATLPVPTLVAVGGRRGISSLVAFLAIERTGGVYLPIDHTWPLLRIEGILQRSGASGVIVTGDGPETASLIRGAENVGCAVIQAVYREELDTSTYEGVQTAYCPPSPSAPRYVLYTSGSTGLPKGAVVEHQGMLNHLLSKVGDLQLTEDDCVAQTASLTFDISIWQMLVALLVGGRVCFLRDEDVFVPESLIGAVREKGITILEVVPTLLGLLMDECEKSHMTELHPLRILLATGEALPPTTARRWLCAYPDIPLVNAYGPTECSDDVTHHFVSVLDTDQLQIPIGMPVANTQLYLLVADGDTYRACNVDEAGELFVGGICVGRGYLDDRERTVAAFFRDPFGASQTGRLYRTGDVVRQRDSGALEYLGRIDRQVKLNGVRIELGEIEGVIRQQESVSSAAVIVVREPSPAKKSDGGASSEDDHARLVAFACGNLLDVAALRTYLLDTLPRSMVPHEIHVLPELPLTANKKVDYRALETLAERKLRFALSGLSEEPHALVFGHQAICNEIAHLATSGNFHAGSRMVSHSALLEDAVLSGLAGLVAGVTLVFDAQALSGASSALELGNNRDTPIFEISASGFREAANLSLCASPQQR